MVLPSKFFKFCLHGGLLCWGPRHIHWPSIGCGQTGSLCSALQCPVAPRRSAWCSLAPLEFPAHLKNTTCIGAPGSLLIGARLPGGNWAPECRGAATLVPCPRNGALNVKPRGGACAHVNNVAHCGAETKYPWLGPGPLQVQLHVWRTSPRLVHDELTPLLNENGLPQTDRIKVYIPYI